MMTATRRRYAARAALSIMLAAAAGPAPGADPGSGASSHAAPADIVVAATRTARDVQGIPQAVFRLDAARRLQERGDRTLPDLLEGAPSVMVQKTGYAQASPYLRGFTGFRTLFLIDGVPLNNSTFRDGPNQYWNTVDPYACETVELLLGPSSAPSVPSRPRRPRMKAPPPGGVAWSTVPRPPKTPTPCAWRQPAAPRPPSATPPG
jgi:outer membrane receptor protein involved in Fe transport